MNNNHHQNIQTRDEAVQPASATSHTAMPQQPASAIHGVRRVRPSREYNKWMQGRYAIS